MSVPDRNGFDQHQQMNHDQHGQQQQQMYHQQQHQHEQHPHQHYNGGHYDHHQQDYAGQVIEIILCEVKISLMFWPKLNILQENYCILRLDIMPGPQNLPK